MVDTVKIMGQKALFQTQKVKTSKNCKFQMRCKKLTNQSSHRSHRTNKIKKFALSHFFITLYHPWSIWLTCVACVNVNIYRGAFCLIWTKIHIHEFHWFCADASGLGSSDDDVGEVTEQREIRVPGTVRKLPALDLLQPVLDVQGRGGLPDGVRLQLALRQEAGPVRLATERRLREPDRPWH